MEGDSLRVDIARWDLQVDGENFNDFFTRVARDLARHFADLNEISEERYPEYEQAFVDEFLAAIGEIDFLAGFEEGGSSAYSIEGNALVLTTADQTPWEFQRMEAAVDIPTAVARTTWGGLKSGRQRQSP